MQCFGKKKNAVRAPPVLACCLPHRFAHNAGRWLLATARKERESSRSTEGPWLLSRWVYCSSFEIQVLHCISFVNISLRRLFSRPLLPLPCPTLTRLQPPTLRAKLIEPISVLGLQVALAPGSQSSALSILRSPFFVVFLPLSTLRDSVVQLQGVNRFADVDIRIKVCLSPHPPRFKATIAPALHSLPSSINRRPAPLALHRLYPPATPSMHSRSHVALRSPAVARSLRSTQSVRQSPRASSRTLPSLRAPC